MSDDPPPSESRQTDEPSVTADADASASGSDDTRASVPADPETDPDDADTSSQSTRPGERDADTPDEPAEGDGDADATAYTTSVRTLNPTVRWLWIGQAVVVGLLVGVVAAIAAVAAAEAFLWVAPVAFAVTTLLGVAHAILLFRSWEYHVREDSMYLDRGVVTRVQTVVPYVRVQHIDTSRGPLERATGLSSLVVYTAGSRGADVTVPGLTPAEATDLQTRLKALAIESEGEDAV